MSEKKQPTFWQVVRSVLAGAIGVQSNKNRENDFQSDSIWPFVIGGIVFTSLFVISLIVLVRLAD